ncbi:MAG: YeeE/YedE family protein [Burkholderiales bacterium]|nr:MAG: YeeE/YedE family protein [Burkholderiales bacterium]
MKKLIYACLSGLLFSLGLVLSGMTQPAKVLAFLNITGITQGISWTAEAGRWDPSLAFVMGGALMATLMAFAITPKRDKPWAEERFDLPSRKDIDLPLVLGAALFGAGWGLAGYCPGPALASVFVSWDAVIFAASMLVGMMAIRRLSYL